MKNLILQLIKSMFIFIVMVVLIVPDKAFAHPYSASFTNITIDRDKTEVVFMIDSLSLIENIESLDPDGDNQLEPSELVEEEHEIEELVTETIAVDFGSQELTPELLKMELIEKDSKQYVQLYLTYDGFSPGDTFTFLDGFFVGDRNTNYINLVTATYEGQTSTTVLQGNERNWTILISEVQQEQGMDDLGDVSTPTKSGSAWFSFFKLGMIHILEGYDHLLFLIALLLRKQTLKQYIGIVTAFTIAHSITLSLSVLDIVNLPSLFVESVIALSIIYVALENIFRKKIQYRWGLTFAFGLIHGLGFADLLKEMALPKSQLAVALVSFNIGIEVIQVGIVLLCLPILFYLHKMNNSLKVIQIISGFIVISGAYFLVQQLFF
ncbi:HupE/UreJ family protein [Sporosarcina koreensis]|uniref:HupE/UreJ family protein n=1 Tax=Sporosarcina koreensis TaxID=334735 RepID=A0ABW0U2F1_9BACL